jgi:hypothetical protein
VNNIEKGSPILPSRCLMLEGTKHVVNRHVLNNPSVD